MNSWIITWHKEMVLVRNRHLSGLSHDLKKIFIKICNVQEAQHRNQCLSTVLIHFLRVKGWVFFHLTLLNSSFWGVSIHPPKIPKKPPNLGGFLENQKTPPADATSPIPLHPHLTWLPHSHRQDVSFQHTKRCSHNPGALQSPGGHQDLLWPICWPVKKKPWGMVGILHFSW